MVDTKTIRKMVLEMYSQGCKVSFIATSINRTKSTVYRYLEQDFDEIRYPILESEIKEVLFQGDLKRYISNLTYRDICVIRRKFNLYGYNKKSKVKAILEYFKHYSILGLYPDRITRDDIKKAFYRKAREVHPDTNKSLDKSGKEFQEVYQSYNYLLALY